MFNVKTYNRSYLDMWNARMCRPNVEPLVDSVVVAVLKQQGFKTLSYVPRNLYDPAALFEALQTYAPEHSYFIDFDNPEVCAGMRLAFKAFAKPRAVEKLKPVRLDGSLSEVYSLLDIKGDKSAGLTAYGQTKAEAFPTAMRKVRELLSNERRPEPCLAGTRTQAGKLGRLVWGYPLMMTILEGVIARPLLNYLKRNPVTPMAFGQTSAQIGLKMRKAQSHSDYYVSMDASKFDATIQAGVIKRAFGTFRTWFDLNDEVGYGKTVGDIFDIVENYFIHTPIVMPHEHGPLLYRGKRHGVPSGSYFTQLVDSFANVALIGTLDFKFKLKIQLSEVFVLGDDMLFFTNKIPNLLKFATVLSNHYHMKVNETKSVWGRSSDDIHFLGREWVCGLPFRGVDNVIERAVSPERYRNYGEDKLKGASLVVASYGFTAMLRGIPLRANPYQGVSGSVVKQGYTSGLTEFMLKEGFISSRVTPRLY